MAEAPNAATSPVAVPATAQDATYFEQTAKLNHNLENLKTETARELGTQRANSQYREGLFSQQEPATYRNNQAKANAGGILESGINARNRGSIATNYANKRFANTQGLKEREGTLQRRQAAGEYSNTEGLHTAGIGALERGKTKLIQEGPQTPPAPTQAAGIKWSRDPLVREWQMNKATGAPIKWSRNPQTRARQEAARRVAGS